MLSKEKKKGSPHYRHREWQVVPLIPHPRPILRMSYQVACIIPSGDPAFTVNVSEAGSVDDLKFAIKNSMGVALAAVDAVDLKLYQINVDGFDSIVYIEEVQRLAENLGHLTRLNDLALLSSVIPPPAPLMGGSTSLFRVSCVCLVVVSFCGAVAETLLANTAPPPGFFVLRDTKDPFTKLCESFWGREDKIQQLEDGLNTEFHCRQLKRTGYQLHFFPQYLYMRERIDRIRQGEKTHKGVLQRRSVVVLGTPGIGKRGTIC